MDDENKHHGIDLGGALRDRASIAQAVALAGALVGGLFYGRAEAATTITNMHNAPACSIPSSVTLGQRCLNDSPRKAYEITTAGTMTSGPTGNGATINVGGAVAKYLSEASTTSWQAFTASLPATLTNHQDVRFWNDVPGTAWDATSGTICWNLAVTSSATARVTIHPAAGESFSDNANRATHKLQESPNYGVLLKCSSVYTSVMNIQTDFLVFKGMQTRSYAFAGAGARGLYAAVSDATVTNNFFMDNGNHDSSPLWLTKLHTGIYPSPIIANNAFMQPGTPGVLGRCILGKQWGGGRIESNSCAMPGNYTNAATLSASSGLFADVAYGTTVTIRNNAMLGITNPLRYPPCTVVPNCVTYGVPDGHNATDQSTFDHGSLSGQGITVGNIFNMTSSATAVFVQTNPTVAGGVDLRPAVSSPLLRAGAAPANLYSTLDIMGNVRAPGAVDIGAFNQSQGTGASGGGHPFVTRFGI